MCALRWHDHQITYGRKANREQTKSLRIWLHIQWLVDFYGKKTKTNDQQEIQATKWLCLYYGSIREWVSACLRAYIFLPVTLHKCTSARRNCIQCCWCYIHHRACICACEYACARVCEHTSYITQMHTVAPWGMDKPAALVRVCEYSCVRVCTYHEE